MKLTNTTIDQLIVCDQVFHNWGRIVGTPVKPTNISPLKAGYWEYTHWNGAVFPINRFDTIDDYLAHAKPFLLESTKGLHNKAKS